MYKRQDRFLSGDTLQLRLSPVQQGGQAVLQHLAGHLQQYARGLHQLAPGQEGVPVVQVIVGHLKEEPGLQTQGVDVYKRQIERLELGRGLMTAASFRPKKRE